MSGFHFFNDVKISSGSVDSFTSILFSLFSNCFSKFDAMYPMPIGIYSECKPIVLCRGSASKILILEDDFLLCNNFIEKYNNTIQNIDKNNINYNMLYLGFSM